MHSRKKLNRIYLLLSQATALLASVTNAHAGEWIYPSNYHPTTSTTTTTTSTTSTRVQTPQAPPSTPKRSESSMQAHSESPPPAQSVQAVVPEQPAPVVQPPTAKVTTTTTTTTTTTVHVDKGLKPFLNAVRTNYDSWDRNHDGVLDRQELETCAQDFKYTGDAALALAVLKKQADAAFTKDAKAVTTIKLSDMDSVESQANAGEKLTFDYGVNFRVLVSKVSSEPRQLFTGALPHLSKIHQGWTGDCYFLSTLGGLCDTNPRAIIDMIKGNSDGTYTVTFPGRQPMIIPPPTETEIAAYTDASDGFWLNIIEKAWGRTRVLKWNGYTAEPLDTAALYGGFSSEVIPILTGHKASTINFQTKEAKAMSQDVLAASVRKAITNSFANGKIITASKMSHAYTVTEYDTSKDRVTLHNPYGTNGHEKWPDGTLGPQMELGYFSCSMADFIKYYRCIFFEI